MFLAITDLILSQFFTCFLAFLSIFLFLSMVPLRNSEENLRRTNQKLEDQIVTLQRESMAARETDRVWRLEMQRQFDAFRANASAQLAEMEQRASVTQQHLDETLKQSWRAQAGLQGSLDYALQFCAGLPAPASIVSESEAAALRSALDDATAKMTSLQHALALAQLKGRSTNTSSIRKLTGPMLRRARQKFF